MLNLTLCFFILSHPDLAVKILQVDRELRRADPAERRADGRVSSAPTFCSSSCSCCSKPPGHCARKPASLSDEILTSPTNLLMGSRFQREILTSPTNLLTGSRFQRELHFLYSPRSTLDLPASSPMRTLLIPGGLRLCTPLHARTPTGERWRRPSAHSRPPRCRPSIQLRPRQRLTQKLSPGAGGGEGGGDIRFATRHCRAVTSQHVQWCSAGPAVGLLFRTCQC
jgi:hypothetical protein